MLEINKELVLSTCHVREGELSLTDDFNCSKDECLSRYHVESMIINVEEYSTCNNLKTLLVLARNLECKWLVLDCDGNSVDFLPKFDW